MTESPPPGYNRLTLQDLWEILRLPVLFALSAIAVTWLIWYLTNVSCTSEVAETVNCNPSRIARYVNLEVLNKMVTHAAIAGGGGGLWSYTMITRERRAREAAERKMAEILAQAAQEREQAAQEREQAAQEREQAAQEREQAAQQAAQEREQAAQQAAQEREQAAAERRQLLSLIEQLTEQLVGGNGRASQ